MKNKNTIYALGFFDGVHLGHQALLSQCVRLAEKTGARAGVVTFVGHPDALVRGTSPLLINTYGDRKMLLERYHMDTVLELPFDRALMQMPWKAFFHLLMEEHGAAGLVCGEDFRFGDRGEGNAVLLQEACEAAGIPCCVVPQQTLDGVTISSTHIRSLLEAGEMAEAVRFLGHPHFLTGRVISGRRLGRTLGIPTANLRLPEGTAALRHGVYACKAQVDGKTYLAVTNIGDRPTVGGHHVTVEPWLLDFDGDLYGRELTLAFYAFLRPEQKFASLEELKAEVQKNALQTRKIFENT